MFKTNSFLPMVSVLVFFSIWFLNTPTIQAGTEEKFDVKDFGAVGDGITDDTKAFQDAVRKASNSPNPNIIGPTGKPQGVVEVPAGVWALNGLRMLHDVRMEVDAGAELRPAFKDPSKTSISLISLDGRHNGDQYEPLQNVTIIGVGESMKNKPTPVEGWDITHSFTLNLDPEDFGDAAKQPCSDPGPATKTQDACPMSVLFGINLYDVHGFDVENIFAKMNDSNPDGGYPTSQVSAITLSASKTSPINGPFRHPTDGKLINIYGLNGAVGFGVFQIASCHHITISHAIGIGGVVARFEGDGFEKYLKKHPDAPPIGNEISDVTVDDVECVNGAKAVQIVDHGQVNRDLTISNVKSINCDIGIKFSGYSGDLPQGGFQNVKISNVSVQGGPGAQVWKNVHNSWTVGQSTAVCREDNHPPYPMDLGEIQSSGTFTDPNQDNCRHGGESL